MSSSGNFLPVTDDQALKESQSVILTGSFVNLLLSSIKLIAGIYGNSSAMVADAAHSISDFVSDGIVWLGIKISYRPRDENHHYGHGKFETLLTVMIGFFLIGIGLATLFNGGKDLYRFYAGMPLKKPTWLAFGAAILSILAKEIIFRWTQRSGVRLDSSLLKANAWHHRTDALSSVGAAMGIGPTLLLSAEWRILDPIAAMGIGIMIIKVGFDISAKRIMELTESSLNENLNREILEIIDGIDGAESPHNLKTRRIGRYIAIDVHVRVMAEMIVRDAHNISNQIEETLRDRFGKSTQITIHIEPIER